MKNKIQDLRDHLFEQMERLNNDELTPEELQREVTRASAMSELGKVIVDSAKTQVLAQKWTGEKKGIKTISEGVDDFTETAVIPLERPKAVYNNKNHQAALEA
jgi:hypothetical protein